MAGNYHCPFHANLPYELTLHDPNCCPNFLRVLANHIEHGSLSLPTSPNDESLLRQQGHYGVSMDGEEAESSHQAQNRIVASQSHTYLTPPSSNNVEQFPSALFDNGSLQLTPTAFASPLTGTPTTWWGNNTIAPDTSATTIDTMQPERKGKGRALPPITVQQEASQPGVDDYPASPASTDFSNRWRKDLVRKLMRQMTEIIPAIQNDCSGSTVRHLLRTMMSIHEGHREESTSLPLWVHAFLQNRLAQLESDIQDITPAYHHSNSVLVVQHELHPILRQAMAGVDVDVDVETAHKHELDDNIVFEEEDMTDESRANRVKFVQSRKDRKCVPSAKGKPVPGNFGCSRCGVTFRDKGAYLKHWLKIDPQTMWECMKCHNKMFVLRERLVSHLRSRAHSMTSQHEIQRIADEGCFTLRFFRTCKVCLNSYDTFKDYFDCICHHMEKSTQGKGRKRERGSDDTPPFNAKHHRDDDDHEGGYREGIKSSQGHQTKTVSSGGCQSSSQNSINVNSSSVDTSRQRSCAYQGTPVDDLESSDDESNDDSRSSMSSGRDMSSVSSRTRYSDLDLDEKGICELAKQPEEVELAGTGWLFLDGILELCSEYTNLIESADCIKQPANIKKPRAPRKSFTWPQSVKGSISSLQSQITFQSIRSNHLGASKTYIIWSGEFYLSRNAQEGPDDLRVSLQRLMDKKGDVAALSTMQPHFRNASRIFAHLCCSSPYGWQVQSHGKREIKVLEHLTQTFGERCNIEEGPLRWTI
ncbi:MAG: hypothetical protein M1828_006323 [Chrysothrix sp. TS-e1954]|nr:MAG: hypothetical protein M1828_006323 [Chrysothrix sp. TS-e1954]